MENTLIDKQSNNNSASKISLIVIASSRSNITRLVLFRER